MADSTIGSQPGIPRLGEALPFLQRSAAAIASPGSPAADPASATPEATPAALSDTVSLSASLPRTPGLSLDTLPPADPSLSTLMRANAFAQVRSAPSSKAKAYVDHGLQVKDGDGRVHPVFNRNPNAFQWLNSKTLLVEADHGGDEQDRLYLVHGDGTPWEGTQSCSRPLEAVAGGRQELCFRAGPVVYYRTDARSAHNYDLHTYDSNTGEIRSLFEGQGDMDYVLQGPDQTLIASRTESNTTNSLHVVDPSTGQSRRLTPEGNAKYRPLRFQPDGKLLCLSNEGREFMAPCALDVQTGESRLLASPPGDTEQVAFSPDNQRIACATNAEGYSRLSLYDATSGAPLPAPDLPKGVVSQLSFKDDKTVRFSMNTADAPNRSGELSLEDGSVKWNGSGEAATPGRVTPELVHYTSQDGTPLSAFLYRPSDADPHAPLPAVIQLHGGPESQSRPRFDPMVQHLVDKGIAVLTPNVRGSLGFGKTYLDADNGAKRSGAIEDVRASAEYLKKIGVDPQRIALLGPSYGGYLALAALAFLPDEKWAAAVEQAGPSDLETVVGPHDPYAAEFGTDAETLRQLSPLHGADQIEAPLLVIHGEHDAQVPKDQSDRMVAALRDQGKTVEYLELPNEGHLLRDPDTKEKTYSYMAQFLSDHLHPQH